jgi:hypothetical protein
MLPLWITGCGVTVRTQTGTETSRCEPKLRANRHKEMRFQSMRFTAFTFPDHKASIRILPQVASGGYDSVYVRYANGVSTAFKADNAYHVRSPVIRYFKEGTIYRDSLDLTIGRDRILYGEAYMPHYTRIYTSNQVVLTTNETIPSRRYYYRNSGYDSVFLAYTGPDFTQVRQDIRYDEQGNDTAAREWDNQQRLTVYKTTRGLWKYDVTGGLKRFTSDTLIANRSVTRQINYYPNGHREAVIYHYNDSACETWRYYYPNGKLLRIVRHTPAARIPILVLPPPPPAFSLDVERLPEFRGDYGRFLNEQLAPILCNSRAKLLGDYHFKVYIDASGLSHLNKTTGYHAEGITAELKNLFSGLPKWKTRQIHGCTADTMWMDVRVNVH